jgi:hypothetical protein
LVDQILVPFFGEVQYEREMLLNELRGNREKWAR